MKLNALTEPTDSKNIMLMIGSLTRKHCKSFILLVRLAGIEPATLGFGGHAIMYLSAMISVAEIS